MIPSATSAPVNPGPPATFHVLLVCTANLCRSPIAEFMLRAKLPEGAGWKISSAGTRARPGSPMHPLAADVLREHGHDPSRFRTTQLDDALIASADLVLCAERTHRAEVVRSHPPAVRRTFTLREFARLLTDVGPSPASSAPSAGAWLIEQAHGNRSAIDPSRHDADDVPDPMGRRWRAFRRCAVQIDDVATAIARPLR